MNPFLRPPDTGASDSNNEQEVGPDVVRVRCTCGVPCVRSLLHSDRRWVHEDDTIVVKNGRVVGGPLYDHEPALDVIEATATVHEIPR